MSLRHGSATLTRLRAAGRPASGPAGGSAASFFSPGTANSTTRFVGLQVLLGEGLDGLRGGAAIALQMSCRQVVGRAQVMFVAVQPIGLAAEAAERLEPGDDAGFDGVLRAFQLGRRPGPCWTNRLQLLVDDRFELLRGVAWPAPSPGS